MNLLFFWLSAQAATLSVGSTQTYPTLQDAVNAATDGDTIELDPEDYVGPTDLGAKSLTIVGLGTPTLHGDGIAPVIAMSGGTVLLQNLDLDGGDSARAIEMLSGSLVLDGVYAHNGFAPDHGGVVKAAGTSLELVDSTLETGVATSNGGLLYADLDLTLRGATTLIDGRAASGGGAYVRGALTDLSITDSVVFQYNHADGAGGGLTVFWIYTLSIDGATFTENDANTGGGVHLDMTSYDFTISNATFSWNSALGGGGLWADHQAGGGATLYLDDSTFTFNQAGDIGGAAYFHLDDIAMNRCTFDTNSATTAVWGGVRVNVLDNGFESGHRPGSGGAVALHGETQVNADLVYNDCLFTNNFAEADGGALMEWESFGATRRRNTFDGNAADRGGAHWIDAFFGKYLWEDTVYRNNFATTSGGAIWNDCSLHLDDVLFEDNSVDGTSTEGGGAIFNQSIVLDVSASDFVSNWASYGGAIWTDDGQIDLVDSRFEANWGDLDGSALWTEAPTDALSIERSVFCANQGSGRVLAWEGSDAVLDSSVFFDNTGGASLDATTDLQLVQLHWIGNGGDLDLQYLTSLYWNNLVAFNAGGLIEGGLWHDPSEGFNLYYGNTGPVGAARPGDHFGDPLLLDASLGVDCDVSRLYPAPGSPAIDGGRPDLLDGDGSRSDIGAFGGTAPQGTPWDPVWDCPTLAAWYPDTDGDGIGGILAVHACAPIPGWVGVGGDCDDSDPAVGAPVPVFLDADGDGYGGDLAVDCIPPTPSAPTGGDCDDTDPSLNPGTLWYLDTDLDGYGDPLNSVASCTQPPGALADDTDCDDGDAAVNPGTWWYDDFDADGFGDPGDATQQCTQPAGHVLDDGDCNDLDPAQNPNSSWWTDADGDGYGDPTSTPQVQCPQTPGTAPNPDDCDDTDPNEHPDAWWYPDLDGDGFGDESAGVQACERPAGMVATGLDCDDADPGLNPNTLWFRDEDGDRYGVPFTGTQAQPTGCEPPAPTNWSRTDDDCDDLDPAVNPAVTWYADADGDGAGDPDHALDSCEPVPGYVLVAGDCDDTDPDAIDDCAPTTTATGGPTGTRTGTGGADTGAEPKGCGCSHSGSGTPGWLPLGLGVLLLRRRRWIGAGIPRASSAPPPGPPPPPQLSVRVHTALAPPGSYSSILLPVPQVTSALPLGTR